MRGFTLVELLIVISIVALIGALIVPIGVRFFQTQALDETANNILATLRRAEHQAFNQKNDDNFGVMFLDEEYVLFQGNSYAARLVEEDEIFSLEPGVTTEGIQEIVFEKFTGIPDTAGAVIARLGENSRVLSINAKGKIERE